MNIKLILSHPLILMLLLVVTGCRSDFPGDDDFEGGLNLYHAGEYALAHDRFKLAYEAREPSLGLSNSETISSLIYACAALYMDGRAVEAKEFVEPHLERIGNEHGSETPEYAKLEAEYGTALRGMGEHEEAIERLRHSLEIHVASYGDEHQSTLSALHKLNLALSEGGHAEEAVISERRLLQLRTKVLGKAAPDTIRTMTNLSYALAKTGEHEEAAQLDEESLRLREAVFGENHPELYVGMVNYAVSLGRAEKFDEAIKLCEPAYLYFERVNGPDHPDTIWAVRELIFAYRCVGDELSAEVLEEKHGL